MNRQMREKLVERVRQYLETIGNDDQRMVCFLLMHGCTPEDICSRMRISPERYEFIRKEIEVEMRNFGLAPEDWHETKVREDA